MTFRPTHTMRSSIVAACLAVVLIGSMVGALQAQPAAKKIPEPEDLNLETTDGVELKATYYPGTRGKDTVPIIMLHMWKGSRADYDSLALYLQRAGHAVVVPDLRGHGRSTSMKRGRETVELDAALLRKVDLENMVRYDVEAVKSFLLERNNEGLLNVEKLCVIGAEMGATVGLNWAVVDWSWRQLPALKQGRDVKAMVLISPEWAFRGMPINQAVAHPIIRQELSMMIVVGNQDSKAFKNAKRLFSTLEKFHPLPPASERAEKQDLFFLDSLRTRLQGTQMLSEGTLKLEQQIAQFIDLRLVKKSFPWTDRTSPLSR